MYLHVVFILKGLKGVKGVVVGGRDAYNETNTDHSMVFRKWILFNIIYLMYLVSIIKMDIDVWKIHVYTTKKHNSCKKISIKMEDNVMNIKSAF